MDERGIVPVRYQTYVGDTSFDQEGYVVEEVGVCIHINGHPWVNLMCSPHAIEDLVLGFLRGEGIITTPDEVLEIAFSPAESCVDVWLREPPDALPSRLTLTSGCGGGVTFVSPTEEVPAVRHNLTVSPASICQLMGNVVRSGRLYRQARGIHAAALADAEQVLLLAEDIGRHNAVDRVWGQAMRAGVETRGRILLTTGRVSSEMLRKAALMGAPIVASRTSPTSLSVELARHWNITLIGYVRRNGLRVYTGEARVRA